MSLCTPENSAIQMLSIIIIIIIIIIVVVVVVVVVVILSMKNVLSICSIRFSWKTYFLYAV